VDSIFTRDGNKLAFLGNVYKLVQTSAPAAAASAPEQPAGQTFVHEARLRADITKQPWAWELQAKKVVCNEADVYGRFYATDKLMECIDPRTYEQMVARGVVDDTKTKLNTRFALLSNQYVGRRPTRRAAVGAAIASQLVLGDGIAEEEA